MLGEQIGELTGKITGTRVLPGDDYRYVKMEVSYQQSGQVYGVQAMDVGTYTVFERVPGQLYGEGQGITQGGSEGAIWRGHGVGKMAGQGMSGQRCRSRSRILGAPHVGYSFFSRTISASTASGS